jgi:L-alanine-DL-glutamate epimerase-like enolase superfamily enzyme
MSSRKKPEASPDLSGINTRSHPSRLEITDLRTATVVDAPMKCTLIRLDTNQGIYGLGEVRDWASKRYALMLKPRLLGENPCNVEKLFRRIKQFGSHGRQGGGVSAVEMALLDLVGKVYGVPVFQLLGGKYRETVRCYCDTTTAADGEEMGRKLKERIRRGFTFLKMDLGIQLLRDAPDALSYPTGALDDATTMHPFTGIRITDKGIRRLSEYAEAARECIGYAMPLAVDHIGHIGLEDGIRFAQAMERFSFAWIEDLLPWQYPEQYVRLSKATATPLATGEDIFGAEGFEPLLRSRAISVCHPDPATAGGIMETKKIGDLAQASGVSMALHMAGTPVACMAAVHAAAATENFLVLENHSVDVPWWDDLVAGLPSPIIQDGFIAVPSSPGLGLDLVEDTIRRHLDPEDPGYFEPTSEWDRPDSWDRLWS